MGNPRVWTPLQGVQGGALPASFVGEATRWSVGLGCRWQGEPALHRMR